MLKQAHFNTHFIKILSFMALFVSLLCVNNQQAYANKSYLEFIANGYDGEYINSNSEQFIGSTLNSFYGIPESNFIYADPDVRALAHLYWALNYYNLNDEEALTNFVKINDCELYKKFSINEFEWGEILNATRNYIRNNKKEFISRFEFILPIGIDSYDEKEGTMLINKATSFASKRRFVLNASDARTDYCNELGNYRYGYPRALILELSRPFNLKQFSVTKDLAQQYTDMVSKEISKYSTILRTKELISELRKAYLYLRLQIYTYDPIINNAPDREFVYIKVLATLEGYTIYGGPNRKLKLHEQNFVNDSALTTIAIQEQIDVQIQALMKKANDKGVFH